MSATFYTWIQVARKCLPISIVMMLVLATFSIGSPAAEAFITPGQADASAPSPLHGVSGIAAIGGLAHGDDAGITRITLEQPLPTSRIAFVKQLRGSQNEDIYVMDEDGSNQVQLTSHAGKDRGPAWSLDGSKIAFHSDRTGNWEIFVMDAEDGEGNGDNLLQLTNNGVVDAHADWSPDGKLTWDSGGHIYIMDAEDSDGNGNGDNMVPFTTTGAPNFVPQWSPDGNSIVWSSERDGDWEIYLADIGNGDYPTQLTNNGGVIVDDFPSWSPNGDRITFDSNFQGGLEIYTMDASNVGNPQRLTTNSFDDRNPTWSRDDQQIAFRSNREGNQDIFVMDASTGANQTNLTESPTYDEWSPDWLQLVEEEENNTPVGAPEVVPVDGTTGGTPVTVIFTNVDVAGQTTLETSGAGAPPPTSFRLGAPPTYFDISTTAEFTDLVEICIDYSDISFGNEANLKLFHVEADGSVVDVTTSLDTDANIICGESSFLSPFFIAEEDTTSPEITGTVAGAQGANGWYVSDVAVTWTVSDPETGIDSSSGCGPVTLTEDTLGETLTCTATNGVGVSSSESATIKIDQTNPEINITSPAEFAVDPVDVDVNFSVSDGLSGVQSLVATLEDGTDPITISSGHTITQAGIYTLTVEATDNAGNQSDESRMFVVYDPAAGFATGGGWIIPGNPGNSDPDDLLPGIDGSSKATFGFVVKYKKGATTTPEGQLEFVYHVGNFNIHSTNYEWLVVTNQNRAMFQGLATIDGEVGLYPFWVEARDGDNSGGNQADRFTIKIWAPSEDPDVDELDYKASGDLGGGQIKIQD